MSPPTARPLNNSSFPRNTNSVTLSEEQNNKAIDAQPLSNTTGNGDMKATKKTNSAEDDLSQEEESNDRVTASSFTPINKPKASATRSMAPNDFEANIQPDRVNPTTSTKRMTRSQASTSGNTIGLNQNISARRASKKSKKETPATSPKEISEEDRARYAAQRSWETFTIPPPRHTNPAPPPRPVEHYVAEPSEKPADPDAPVPQPLPTDWHRRWNDLRAAEMAAEERNDDMANAKVEAARTLLYFSENPVVFSPTAKTTAEKIAAARTLMSMAASSVMPPPTAGSGYEEGTADNASPSLHGEESGPMEADSDANDVSFVAGNKGKGEALRVSPEDSDEPIDHVEATPIGNTPVVTSAKPARIRLYIRRDKGKGKAVSEETEEPIQASENNSLRVSSARISDDYNGVGEPTIASSSRDNSTSYLRASDAEKGPIQTLGSVNEDSKMMFVLNPEAKSHTKLANGYTAINDGSHNRSRVILGIPQPQALTIVFKTGKEDPDRPGFMRHLANVTYQYTNDVDWNDPKIIRAINKWRDQIFLRLLGNKGETRYKWAHEEMKYVCDLVELNLSSKEVDGSWARIDWECVAAVYNSHFKGKIQKAGQFYAHVTYKSDTGNTVRSDPGSTMAADREAPVRTAEGMKNQMIHFADQRAINLVKYAKGQTADASPTPPSHPQPTPSAAVRPKTIILMKKGQKSVVTHKRAREQDDEQGRPASKKAKLDDSGVSLRASDPPHGNSSGSRQAIGSGSNHQRPISKNKRSREVDEDVEGDEDEGPAPKKVKVHKSRSRVVVPDSSSLLSSPGPTESERDAIPSPRKRSRENEETDEDDDSKHPRTSKKIKLVPAQHNPRPSRTPVQQTTMTKGSKASPRLPTVDDYFSED